jgi:hypothetical protein
LSEIYVLKFVRNILSEMDIRKIDSCGSKYPARVAESARLAESARVVGKLGPIFLRQELSANSGSRPIRSDPMVAETGGWIWDLEEDFMNQFYPQTCSEPYIFLG